MKKSLFLKIIGFLTVSTATAVDITIPDAGFDDHGVSQGDRVFIGDDSYSGAWQSHNVDQAWIDFGDYWPDGLPALSGNYTVYTNRGSENYIYQILDETFIEGQLYTLSVWVGQKWRGAGTANSWWLYFTGEDDTHNLIEASGSATDYWQQVSLEYMATAADAGKKIGIKMRGEEAWSGSVAFENVTLSYHDPAFASHPIPAHGQTDVPRDVVLSWEPGVFSSPTNGHQVYLGDSFDAVNDAAGGIAQTDASYAPAHRLEFGKTYYWRVDELSADPDDTIYKGDVWSFTIERISNPISDISASASSSFGLSVPENTVNGSGMIGDLHGTLAPDMWISAGVPATIEYAFDRVYKLHELWIWNSNQRIEPYIGFGAKDIVIEYSPDGENWTVLNAVGPLAQAPGAEDYAHNNTIDFDGAMAQHVRVTVNSAQGVAPQVSLSEVRFYYRPTIATHPDPAPGATGVAPDTTLSWDRNGFEADHHEIYVGTDANDLPWAGSVRESSFSTAALDLQLGQTYFWRVDEVNDAMDPSTWTGEVWRFTTVDAIIIDDMERYADEELREIWASWVDGFDDADNGSVVGNGDTGAPETGRVHGGSQSLPIFYDNSAATQSEATQTFDAPMDWTEHGAQSLVLYFRGMATNTGGRIYAKINDTKIAYDGDASSLMSSVWNRWTITLAETGADLSRVLSLAIGVDGGGMGVVYVDDIGLYRNAPLGESAFLDLSDLIAGGDGTGEPVDGIYAGVHLDTGAFLDSPLAGWASDEDGVNPSPVGASDFIDSVFLLSQANMPISTAGVPFIFDSVDSVSNGWSHVLANISADLLYANGVIQAGDRTDMETCVAMVAAAGVTFDLAALRAYHGADAIHRFTSYIGMDGGTDGCQHGGFMTLMVVFSNENEILKDPTTDDGSVWKFRTRRGFGAPYQAVIPPEATFLTLISGAGDNGNGCDHGVFGNPRIRAR